MSMQPPPNQDASMARPAADDQELQPVILRARAGDVAAFNQLVDRFQRSAFGVALRMLGDREMAADATQDAIVSAFKNLGRFRGGSFRVWLMRIVTNQCLDVLRVQQRRRNVSLDAMLAPASEDETHDVPHNAGALVDVTWDPVQLAEQHELQALLQRGLLTLPEEQRLTLVLSDIEGMSYEEIAEITQTNTGTVKSRLARGRARLRDFLVRYQELLPRKYRHHT